MLELTLDGALARLTIQRPEKKNAFNEAMWASLLQLCERLALAVRAARADAPRVLLVQGSGGAFCAGADIEEMRRRAADAAWLTANNRTVSQAQLALERLPLPTLALIDGPCFGGGFGIAAACDFRLATPESVFAITPARLGLLYSLEDTRRVVALVGDARARRLLLRSERLSAATALQWGVVDALVNANELQAAATQWAAGLAAQSPTSMAGIKATLALINGNGEHTEASIREQFEQAFAGADFAEGTRAFLERRQPAF